GTFVELSRADCGFEYRTSIFNTTERDRYIVLEVSYRLQKDATPVLKYPDVQRVFEGKPGIPSLTEVREAVRRIRAAKGMLIVEGDPDCRSAGSFFKNPLISEVEYGRLQGSGSEPVPRYPASHGLVKTSAAWLIERSGFRKGFSMGPA